MEIIGEIKSIIISKLVDLSQFFVDVIVKGHKGFKKVFIVIDGDNGVMIDDCVNLSCEFLKIFDDMGLFDDSYMLEVFMLGLDQFLKLK